MERGGSDDVLVAATKPVRGREMIATKVPFDIFNSIRLVSVKRTSRDDDLTSELPKQKKDNVETFYEGYVDGKKYLVPDSSLEAMKDTINLGMRQRRSTRFKHQTSADEEDLMTIERIDKMLSKIKNLSLSMSVASNESLRNSRESAKSKEEDAPDLWPRMSSLPKSESKTMRSSSTTSRPKVKSKSRSDSQKSSSSKKGGLSSPKSSLLSIGSVLKDNKTNYQQSEVENEEEESDDCYLRLVLSGHFKNNENPVYIIQEYNKKSNLFCKHSADFTSSQTQGNVHVFMAGKLFKENILEEIDGKPNSLTLKPNKIMIDASKCKVFRSYFENTYSRKSTDITIKGEFLQNDKSMDITPFLSVIIKQNSMNESSMSDNERDKKRTSILVKNRQSGNSIGIESPKDTKRVSFKDSFDDEELYVIYKSIKNKPPEESLLNQVIYPDKEGHHKNKVNRNQKSSKNNQIVVSKRKVLERVFYLITENSFFKKLFTKRK